MNAFRDSQFDVLDALVNREIWFPEAIHLFASKGGGWPSVRNLIQSRRAANTAPQHDALNLLARFLSVHKNDKADKTLRGYSSHVHVFIDWLQTKYNVAVVDPVKFFTRENLRLFRDELIETRHAKAVEKLEARWSKLADAAPPQVEREQILERDKGAKRSTANRYVNSVGSFSTWLVDEGVLTESPAVGVRWTTATENATRQTTFRYFSAEHLRVFLDYSRRYDAENPRPAGKPAPDTLFWRFLASTGATTQNEGSRFCVEDLKLRREQGGLVPLEIKGTKSVYRNREVYVTTGLADELKKRAKEIGVGSKRPVFPFSHDDYLLIWGRIMRVIEEDKPAGWEEIVDHTPYDLRHTFAVNALEAGMDIEQLSRLMGHNSITTTHMYAKHQTRPDQAILKMVETLGLD